MKYHSELLTAEIDKLCQNKDGFTKLLGLRLKKNIRSKIGLWPLQSMSELVSNMGCTCKHTQVKCWKEMVDYHCYPFVMSISLSPPENLLKGYDNINQGKQQQNPQFCSGPGMCLPESVPEKA